jgi:hypothetical protein
VGFLNGGNESSVSRFVRVAAAACLQKLSKPLKRTWVFFVAFDSSTIEATSYFDVRVRLAADAELHSFPMLALPLHGSHRLANVCRLRAGDRHNYSWLGRRPAVNVLRWGPQHARAYLWHRYSHC